jgi:hypothetical protein
MPTSRPRYQITETPEVSRALDRAAERWPGEPRSKLLLRLIKAGDDGLRIEAADRDHRTAVLASSGKYAEAFPSEYLAELRGDWPE